MRTQLPFFPNEKNEALTISQSFSSRLTNSVNKTAYNSFNKWGGLTFEDILSNYPKETIDKCWIIFSKSITRIGISLLNLLQIKLFEFLSNISPLKTKKILLLPESFIFNFSKKKLMNFSIVINKGANILIFSPVVKKKKISI